MLKTSNIKELVSSDLNPDLLAAKPVFFSLHKAELKPYSSIPAPALTYMKQKTGLLQTAS